MAAGAGVSRRALVRWMGASFGLAGVGGCTRAPREEILPYARQPPEVTPGTPLYYSTFSEIDGYALGLVVETHEGRPTKVEGNPDHPDSLGATGPLEQALVLTLYEPSRARSASRAGEPATFAQWIEAFASEGVPSAGAGLHFLLEPISSPSLIDRVARVRTRLPAASFHFHSPLGRDNVREGARAAYGRVLEPLFDLRAAQVIVVLGGDPLVEGPGFVRHARGFADGRRLAWLGSARPEADRERAMNRLYVAEAGLSSTGALADHRIAL